MGKDTPRYFVTIKGSHYWQPSSELRARGWTPHPLGKDRSRAVAYAIELNGTVDRWRAEGCPARDGTASAAASRVVPGTCNALFDLYQACADYPTNKHTRRQYDDAIAYARKWIGPVPVRAVTPRMAKQRYDALAKATPAMAAGRMRVLRACFGQARFLSDPGQPLYVGAKDNPFLELNLKNTESEGRLWTALERDALSAAAMTSNAARYPSIALAIELNWWLGQREGDILALPPNALEGDTLTIGQNKTRRRVHLPIGIVPRIHELAVRCAALRKEGVQSLTHLLICEDTGQPWDEHAFRKAFRRVREAAGCDEALQFMYLRHTAVVEMQDAGAETSEIAAVTGHSMQTVNTLLERYGRRTRVQSENAIRKRMRKDSGDGGV